ncbi:MAG: hypothetical protein LQ349_003784 [Xanthoria aureola]|nr:MAG: hypothetical protein LQ349_003784 [Xanthoria aureola]
MASPPDHSKPAYGSRLLPQVLDDLAITNPERVYACFPTTTDLKDGFRSVTMAQMARAVNHMAWWLDNSIGTSPSFETVSYLGLPDIRYAIFFLAAVKCGYKVLFPSPRNTVQINVSLLDQTQCFKFFVSSEMLPVAESLQKERKQLRFLAVPTLNEMLVDASEPYLYDKDYATARWDPMVVLHSSGSTGIPKPIVMNHATYAVVDNDRNLATVPGRRNQNFSLWNFGDDGGFSFSSFPPFHLGGFVAYIVLPIYSTHSTVVLGPPNKPSTGQTAAEVLRQLKLKALFCPPNIYEQLLQEPDGLELTKGLDFVMYAGGPLTTATGTALSKVTEVCGFYGSTETGPSQTLVPAREDWDTLEFHPLYGADMQPSVDEAYELVLHRDSKLEGIRGLDNNFPNIDTWRTKDLFRPHASKPNLWRFHGRTDDIIVLSNGEKFNPVPSEAIINSHPLVSAALIIGQGRFQAALLIEPVKTDESKTALVEQFWPTIEKANAQAQGHGRITRTMIVVAGPMKPFERAGKGTVVRKLTVEKYAAEIEALYSDDVLPEHRGGPRLSNATDINALREFLRQTIDMSFPVRGVAGTDDLYVLGLDSLKTLEIISLVKAGVRDRRLSWLTSQTLYTNPTIGQLAEQIYVHLNPASNGDSNLHKGKHVNASEHGRIEAMRSLVEKYTSDLKESTTTGNPQAASSKCFALTGSTGSLGRRLLLDLIKSPQVSKIYCLDRGANAKNQHTELQQQTQTVPVEFLQVDYGRSDLGLTAAKYTELVDSVSTIIHGAWKVDFNHSLASYSPVHLRGLRNIIDLSMLSRHRPRIIFISSTSSVSRYPQICSPEGAMVPEHHISSHAAAQHMGYAESKNVAEHILYHACQKAGISSTILRVGQIAGPIASAGVWNPDEWVPALIRSSQNMGVLPNGVPLVDWIPVDSLSKIIVELCLATTTSPQPPTEPSIYNLVNPNRASWSSLIDTIKEYIRTPSSSPIDVIPLEEWVTRLSTLDPTSSTTMEKYPAAKILPFFTALAEDRDAAARTTVYSTAHGVRDSATMAGMKAIDGMAMGKWMQGWGYQKKE